MAEKEKPSVSAALNEVTRFLNIFPNWERIREALTVVTDLEGQVATLKKEAKEAEDVRKHTLRLREEADLLLEEKQKAVVKIGAAYDATRHEEAKALQEFRAHCVKETDEFRAKHVAMRQKIVEETLALEAKRSDLAKAVREMETGVTETKQARIQGE